MPSLHIGTITFDWYPMHSRVRRLAEAAADAEYSVDVICLRRPEEKYYEVYNGVHIYRMPLNRRFDSSLPITILRWCWFLLLAGVTITWLHLKRPYDVIHVHNLPDFLVFSALFPKLLKAKIILDVQDVSPELMAVRVKGRLRRIATLLAGWQEYISTAFADHVVTVGWPFEELLLKRGVPKEKITIILNSADPKLFPTSRRPLPSVTLPNEAQPFILMYHGTVSERQGLDTALRAISLVHPVVPQIRLHIKGWGDQLHALKELAVKLGIGNQVVFSDWCDIEEVVDFVVQGDVGIIPYRNDGFMDLLLPTKAYEFAWMHRPMIASDITGMRSMFRPESVFFCNSTQPESFAEAIIELYQHPEKRASLVANAAEDYMPYKWEIEAKRYQQLLASLCKKLDLIGK